MPEEPGLRIEAQQPAVGPGLTVGAEVLGVADNHEARAAAGRGRGLDFAEDVDQVHARRIGRREDQAAVGRAVVL
jgi:hypothetical protein